MIVVYAITGRSSSSQARKLVQENDTIWTRPTDEEVLKKGQNELLLYPAVCVWRGIAVSNGRQTLDIKKELDKGQNPSEILRESLSGWEYEPDPPVYTPRIAGCVLSLQKAALGIVKRDKAGYSRRDIFEFHLVPGKGKLISTYEGKDKESLLSFSGEPLDLELREKDSKDMAEAVYDALGPKEKRKDYRIAVACLFCFDFKSGKYETSIINRSERMKKNHGKTK